MEIHQFLQLSKAEVLAIQRELGRPQAGAFVPDGSRRLVLAYTDYPIHTQEFQIASAHLPAKFLYQVIQIFFQYDLPKLIVPILGRSILKRGTEYLRLTALEGLHLLFNSKPWLDLYEQMDICVRVHGDITCLQGTPAEEAIQWIDSVCKVTANNRSHQLFYAIGESPIVGEQMLSSSVKFFQQHGHIPTREELILAYYGTPMPSLDFFIMTSKMSGMGSLPNLLVDGDTEIYFLPTLKTFTETTYRLMLYDILYARSPLRKGISEFEITTETRSALKKEYEQFSREMIGIGKTVGKIWVPGSRIMCDNKLGRNISHDSA